LMLIRILSSDWSISIQVPSKLNKNRMHFYSIQVRSSFLIQVSCTKFSWMETWMQNLYRVYRALEGLVYPDLVCLFKNWMQSSAVLLEYESVDWSTFCMKFNSPSFINCTSVNAFQSYKTTTKLHSILNNYISITLNTIEIIIICFNIPHFQFLLLCVFIRFYYVHK
jgi:hypothetical protein